MRRLLTTVLLLALGSDAAGQTSDFPVGARAAGMANAAVCLTDIWAIHHNQAGLADLEMAGAAVFYENRFLSSALNLQGAALALPTGRRSGTFGLSFRRFGNTLFHQSSYGLAYGRKLWDFLSVGLQLNYLHTHIAEGYGDRHGFVAEIGLISQITPALRAGFHAYNLTRTPLSEGFDERVPMNFRFGMQYTFSKKVMAAAEVQKDMEFPALFRLGFEYLPVDVLAIRLGLGTNPFHVDFGLGLRLKHFHFDIAGGVHPVLGFSPKAGLAYNFNLGRKIK